MLYRTLSTAPLDLNGKEPSSRAGSFDPIQIVDDAVRSVLREIRGSTKRSRSDAGIFAERLLLLRHVESLAAGTREVKIAPGTVVTPLARDALKRLGIELRFVSRAEVDRARRTGEWAFAIEAESGITTAFRRSLLDDPLSWTELATSAELSEWLGGNEDRGGMLLTDESALAVWRACRVPGIRAAAAETAEAVDRAVQGLGVNLLVIDPRGKSIAFLRQLGLTYRRGGAPRVPEGLETE
jgi:hypothetical protein